MKLFEEKNYYQILKITPDAALCTIHRAYREALAVYDEDALATYALFSDGQRNLVLKTISEAYDTLRDENKRLEYNRMLIETGQVNAAEFSTRDRKQLAALADGRDQSLSAWVTKRSGDKAIKKIKNEIHAKDWVSGGDLKKLREALGIEPEEIYEITRISGSMLQMLEDDRFDDLPAEIYLKYFLRSYAEILQLDPQRIIKGYFNYMVLAAKP
jgi:curved DNA-binding protein CbpA